MTFYIPTMTENGKRLSLLSQYYSVEFAMQTPHPVYQFKLWHSDQNILFLLVKENSDLLPQLKVGHVLPMKYYIDDTHCPTKVRKTQIREIVNETQGRFKGHYRIELEILENCASAMMQ